jgi:hypothetical protein
MQIAYLKERVGFYVSAACAPVRALLYVEPFSIDLAYLKDMTSIGKKKIEEELEGIKKALEYFQNSAFKPLVRTIVETEYRDEQKARAEAGRLHLEKLQREKETKPPGEPAVSPGVPPYVETG